MNRKIFIAKDHKGFPTSMVIIDERAKADIFFQGMGIDVMTVEEIDPNDPDFGEVTQLLKFQKQEIYETGSTHKTEFMSVRRR